MDIILLTGPAGAGKSSAAQFLDQRGVNRYHPMKMAGPIKDMIAMLGLDQRYINGDRRERPLDLLGGKSARYAMQTLGTEWGRNTIHPDLWVNLAAQEIEVWRQLNEYQQFVFDDVRFLNEIEVLQEKFGPESVRTVNIVPDFHCYETTGSVHTSEQQELPWDYQIVNNEGLGKLRDDIVAIADSHA